jgi:hypothetical protein
MCVIPHHTMSHKVIRSLDDAIQNTLYDEAMQKYIEQKHGLLSNKLRDVQTTQLHIYLKRLTPHERASTAKLISDMS